MKKCLLSVLLLSFFTPLFSQQLLPEKDGKVVFEEIDSVQAPQAELYNRSKKWLVDIFKSAKDVLQLDDQTNGKLLGKGNFDYIFTVLTEHALWTCYFTIQIDCRDNKARIRLYDISASAAGAATAEYFNHHAKHAQKHIKAINQNMIGLMASFKAALEGSKDNF